MRYLNQIKKNTKKVIRINYKEIFGIKDWRSKRNLRSDYWCPD
jgi:hypothetical protein